MKKIILLLSFILIKELTIAQLYVAVSTGTTIPVDFVKVKESLSKYSLANNFNIGLPFDFQIYYILKNNLFGVNYTYSSFSQKSNPVSTKGYNAFYINNINLNYERIVLKNKNKFAFNLRVGSELGLIIAERIYKDPPYDSYRQYSFGITPKVSFDIGLNPKKTIYFHSAIKYLYDFEKTENKAENIMLNVGLAFKLF